MAEGGQLPTRLPVEDWSLDGLTLEVVERERTATQQNIGFGDLSENQTTNTSQSEEDSPTTRSSDEREIESSSDDDSVDFEEKFHLSDTLLMFPNKKLSAHRNVVVGEMCSNIECENRSCVIKYDPNQIVREAAALRKLSGYSNVISLFDSGTFNDGMLDISYIVLERCHDLNLEDYLLCDDIVPVYDVNRGLKFCNQIITGMKYVHENLIIHKDLKPSNIFLTHDLENVKIGDFGSSQEVTSMSSMVPSSNIFGTLGYRPPESLEPSHVSLKSDIFSLGVVFHFLLSNGKSPFGSLSDKWDHNTKIGVIDLSQLIVPNPMATQHLINSMLNLERRHRPSLEKVERHPCWNGEENVFRFEYKFEEEVLDCDGSVIEEAPSEKEPDDSGVEFLREMSRLEAIHGPFNKGTLELIRRSEKLMQNFKFYEAANVLRELFNLPGSNKLEVSLQIAECELCSKNEKLDESIQRIRESIPKSLSADDLVKMAEKLKGKGQRAGAMIQFRIAYEFKSKFLLPPDDTASWIGRTVQDLTDTVGPLFESSRYQKIRSIAIEYGIVYTKSLLRGLQALKGVSDDVRATQEARCYECICYVMNYSGEYENAIRFGQKGLAYLEKKFMKSMIKSKHYGILLHNIGVGYFESGQYYDAEEYFNRALKANEKANYEEEGDKKKDLKISEESLKLTRDVIREKDAPPIRWFRRLLR